MTRDEAHNAGRPAVWASKIEANPDALKFYELIEYLQTTTAFRECHIYKGAVMNHVPHVSWGNSVTALPKVLLGFLGIPYRRKLCPTHGCCNPFHYIDDHPQKLKGHTNPPKEIIKTAPLENIDSYKEMVEFYIDKHDVRDFESLRPLIPTEDISDDLLKQVLKNE